MPFFLRYDAHLRDNKTEREPTVPRNNADQKSRQIRAVRSCREEPER